jgi:diguanylate cyclase (GGDEF)-like protein/PAS domain S-box-containing protein
VVRLNQFSTAGLYDGDGVRLVSYPTHEPGPLHIDQDLSLQSALSGLSAVSAVSTGVGSPPLIDFGVTFQSPTGARAFTARYPIEDTLLRSFMTNALPTFHTASVYLVSSAGWVILTGRRDSSGKSLAEVAPALAQAAGRQSQGFLPDLDQYYIAGPVEGSNWKLVFTLDTTELYETLTPTQKYGAWLALIMFCVMSLGLIQMFTRAQAGRIQAEDEHARQQAILDTAGDAFVGIDDTGVITDWNLAAAHLLGWPREQVIGRPALAIMFPPGNHQAYDEGLQAYLRTGISQGPQPATLSLLHHDGYEIPVEVTMARGHWQGRWRIHAFIRDITERLQHERQLHDLALTDSLTGLANRRAFLDQLEQAHARSVRHNTRLAVLYGDVDHFKMINDTYGHAAGDVLLSQVAVRLRSHFRAEDTVGRLGGDEFAVICEDFTLDADTLAQRLCDVLAAPYSFRDQLLVATVSVGLAFAEPGESTEQLLERADAMMYRAKSSHDA